MPKFYYGKQLGFAYRGRPVGWRRMPLLSLLPYLTGDTIRIRLSLEPQLQGQAWQAGIIQIEPPEWRDLNDGKLRVRDSDYLFTFVDPFAGRKTWPSGVSMPPKHDFPMRERWVRTLPLKGGISFGQPCDFQCFLILQNVDDDRVEQTVPIRLADIEVVSRGPFLTQVLMWFLGILASGLVGYLLGHHS